MPVVASTVVVPASISKEAVVLIVPPFVPVAFRVPVLETILAVSSTCPVKSSKEFASTTPVLFTTPLRSSFTALVVKNIFPPSAITAPLFSTKASRTPLSILRFTKEFPFRFMVASLAPVK